MNDIAHTLTRRTILRGLAGAAAWAATSGRRIVDAAQATTVSSADWAHIDAVGENIWAVMSTPETGSFVTLCNGGIIAGRERVLVFEGFGSAEGAAWVAEQARSLTGRAPTDVIVSHKHGDHHAGLGGFTDGIDRPTVWVTESTRDEVLSGNAHEAREMLESATVLAADQPTTIDLDGRDVVVTPYSGHTASDVIATVDETTFCGDLFWIDMIPNFVHATPLELGRSVDDMLAAQTRMMVPGHGPLPDAGALEEYQILLVVIETEGRRSFEAGQTPEEAAAAYVPPETLKAWSAFGSLEPEQIRGMFLGGFLSWHRQLAE